MTTSEFACLFVIFLVLFVMLFLVCLLCCFSCVTAAEEWVQCLFIGMSLSTPNLARTSHDALCQLDLEAALHIMAARCRGQLLAHSREGVEQEHRAWEVKQMVTTHLDAVEVVEKREGEREFEEFWTSALQLNTGQTRLDPGEILLCVVGVVCGVVGVVCGVLGVVYGIVQRNFNQQ